MHFDVQRTLSRTAPIEVAGRLRAVAQVLDTRFHQRQR
jgi:hypothetical protein